MATLPQVGVQAVILGMAAFNTNAATVNAQLRSMGQAAYYLENTSRKAFQGVEDASLSAFSTIVKGSIAAGAAMVTMAAGAAILGAKYADQVAFMGALSDGTAKQIDKLSMAQLELSRHSNQTATNLNTMSTELVKAGFDIESVTNGALKAVNDLVVASHGELKAADAAVAMQVAVAGFHSTVENAANATTSAVQKSTLTFTGFAEAIRQGGVVAAKQGLSINEFAAAVTAAGQTIASGSEIGTGFKTMLTRLQDPSKKAIADMEKYGISLYDANGKARPFVDVLAGLENAFGKAAIASGKLTEAQRDQALAQLFGARAVKVVSALIDQGTDSYLKYLEATYKLKAADLAAAVLAPTAEQAVMLKNNVLALATAFGLGLDPALHVVTSSLLVFAQSIPLESVLAFGNAVGGNLYAGFSTAGVVLNQVLRPALGGFGSALLTALNTLGNVLGVQNAVGAGLAVLGGLYNDASVLVQQFAIAGLGYLTDRLNDLSKYLTENATTVRGYRDNVGTALGALGTLAERAFGLVIAFATLAGKSILQFIDDVQRSPLAMAALNIVATAITIVATVLLAIPKAAYDAANALLTFGASAGSSMNTFQSAIQNSPVALAVFRTAVALFAIEGARLLYEFAAAAVVSAATSVASWLKGTVAAIQAAVATTVAIGTMVGQLLLLALSYTPSIAAVTLWAATNLAMGAVVVALWTGVIISAVVKSTAAFVVEIGKQIAALVLWVAANTASSILSAAGMTAFAAAVLIASTAAIGQWLLMGGIATTQGIIVAAAFALTAAAGLATYLTGLAVVSAASIGRFLAMAAAAAASATVTAMAFAVTASVALVSFAKTAVISMFTAAGAFVMTLVPAVVSAVGVILAAIAPFLLGIVAIGLAAALLAKAWGDNWFDIQGIVGKAVQWIIEKLNGFLDVLSQLPVIGDAIGGARAAVSTFFADMPHYVKVGGDALKSFVTEAIDGFKQMKDLKLPKLDDYKKELKELEEQSKAAQDEARKAASKPIVLPGLEAGGNTLPGSIPDANASNATKKVADAIAKVKELVNDFNKDIDKETAKTTTEITNLYRKSFDDMAKAIVKADKEVLKETKDATDKIQELDSNKALKDNIEARKKELKDQHHFEDEMRKMGLESDETTHKREAEDVLDGEKKLRDIRQKAFQDQQADDQEAYKQRNQDADKIFSQGQDKLKETLKIQQESVGKALKVRQDQADSDLKVAEDGENAKLKIVHDALETALKHRQDAAERTLKANQNQRDEELKHQQDATARALKVQQDHEDLVLKTKQEAAERALRLQHDAAERALSDQLDAQKRALDATQKAREGGLKKQLDDEKDAYEHSKAVAEIARKDAQARADAQAKYDLDIKSGVKKSIADKTLATSLEKITISTGDATSNLANKEKTGEADDVFKAAQDAKLQALRDQFTAEDLAQTQKAEAAKLVLKLANDAAELEQKAKLEAEKTALNLQQEQIQVDQKLVFETQKDDLTRKFQDEELAHRAEFEKQALELRRQTEEESLKLHEKFQQDRLNLNQAQEKETTKLQVEQLKARDDYAHELEIIALKRSQLQHTEERNFKEAQTKAFDEFKEREDASALQLARDREDANRERKTILDKAAYDDQQRQDRETRALDETLEQEEYDRKVKKINAERDTRIEVINDTLRQEQEANRQKLAEAIVDLRQNMDDRIATIKANYLDKLEDALKEGGDKIKPLVDDVTGSIETGLVNIRNAAEDATEALANAFDAAAALQSQQKQHNIDRANAAAGTPSTTPAAKSDDSSGFNWGTYNFEKNTGASEEQARKKAEGKGAGPKLLGGDLSAKTQAALEFATSNLNSNKWNGWCAKFVANAFGKIAAGGAAWQVNARTITNKDRNAPSGSVIGFNRDASNGMLGHIGISMGNDKFISATTSGVQVHSINEPYWSQLYQGWGAPKFKSGVTDFQGGLAYVHQDELLVNLPKGTDVLSSTTVAAVRAAESMYRSGISGGSTVNTKYEYNVNANYGRVQPEGSITRDLSALVALTRS